jgi:asparagine synthase (glutamine-hydrolysing)
MCGICGWYGRRDEAAVGRMVDAIRHRGPDGDGVAVLGGHTLGAARLEIFGGTEARQPWIAEGLGIVFNGEIYNYAVLRSELAADGVRFVSGTETELLLHLYQRDGDRFPIRLRGMFAIALLDWARDRIVLARDPFGIKPFYYATRGGELLFASEIKGLLQAGALQPALDEGILEGLMTFGYVFQQDSTLFRGIRQVEPGGVVVFDGKECLKTRYFEIPPVRRDEGALLNGDLEEAAASVRQLITNALDAHLGHGETDKAFYLSGGVDSSFMAVLAARASSKPITTYTLADNPASEDLLYAGRVARAIGSDHQEVNITLQDYVRSLADYVQHYEHVVAGGVFDIHGGVAFHLLSAEIAKDFKVAFSGEGADELFGGYYWTYTHPLGFADRIRGRCRAIGANEEVQRAVNALFPEPENAWRYRLNLMSWLMRGGLSNYHLCSVDRSGGAFGFEIRPVYLDSVLAQAALGLPVDYKLGRDGRDTKRVLKEAARPLFAELGIDDVLSRQKLGMPWAVHHIENEIISWAESRISDRHLAHHPYRRFLGGKLETVMFDLFHYLFIERRGVLDDGFDIESFLASPSHEHLYS